MSALPNPLQELAEKLVAELSAVLSEHHRQRLISRAKDILEPSVGTLLQAERAAMCEEFIGALKDRIDRHDREASQLRQTASITGYPLNETAWDYHIDCRTTLRGFFADVQHVATPGERSALSAVVQRETAKLRELLSWTMERVGNRMDGFYLSKGDSYDCHYICPGCDADSTIKEFQHKPDCKYAAALEATK